MNRRQHLLALLTSTLLSSACAAADAPAAAPTPQDTRCYELRVYTANEGKLEALEKRFRDHTCKLFEKHGMTNVGYWTPLENADRKLVYILSYPSRRARDKSWADFIADPAWKAAAAESEKDGKLVGKVDSTFLTATDYSPAIKSELAKEPRVFELRTYTCTPGKLPALNERFRNHTTKLFAKHGMTNVGYWTPDAGQTAADVTLVYLLAHKSKEASEESFKAFRADPVWVEAKAASEKAAGGSLTVPDGVKSLLMTPTDFSQMK